MVAMCHQPRVFVPVTVSAAPKDQKRGCGLYGTEMAYAASKMIINTTNEAQDNGNRSGDFNQLRDLQHEEFVVGIRVREQARLLGDDGG